MRKLSQVQDREQMWESFCRLSSDFEGRKFSARTLRSSFMSQHGIHSFIVVIAVVGRQRWGNLQRQLMGGAVGPTIFNCWWWEGVSWDSRWRIPNECCKSLGLPFIKIQLACSAAGAAVVKSSGRLLCSVGRCFKWQREALSRKLLKSGCWGVTPIKTLRPSTSALVVEFNSRFNEKLRRNRNSWRCDGKLWHFQLS